MMVFLGAEESEQGCEAGVHSKLSNRNKVDEGVTIKSEVAKIVSSLECDDRKSKRKSSEEIFDDERISMDEKVSHRKNLLCNSDDFSRHRFSKCNLVSESAFESSKVHGVEVEMNADKVIEKSKQKYYSSDSTTSEEDSAGKNRHSKKRKHKKSKHKSKSKKQK